MSWLSVGQNVDAWVERPNRLLQQKELASRLSMV